MNHEVTAYIAIGSNLGDRLATIESAIVTLNASLTCTVVASSRMRETAPVGPIEQPMYLNGALAVHTTLTPRELLELLLEIERSHGRERRCEQRWGPRRLDLDLLFFGNVVVSEPNLTVPHPRLHERAFVLEPLAEIAPAFVHPGLDQTVTSMLEALNDTVSSEPSDRTGVQKAGGA